MDADNEPWKKLQLSLERPYKDEHGVPIPTLYDINQNGEQFFERFVTTTTKVSESDVLLGKSPLQKYLLRT